METARKLGYSIKLIGHAEKIGGKILAMVSPRLIPHSNPLSGINDVFNGILLGADMVGQVMFYGPGAGKLPTASAVCADIVDVIAHAESGIKLPKFSVACADDLASFDDYACKRFFIFDKCPECKIDSECINKCFGAVCSYSVVGEKVAVITEAMTEAKANELSSKLNNCKAYRVL